MFTCHLADGKFGKQSCSDLDYIASSLTRNREVLASLPIDAIIKILDALGKKVLRNADINTMPGVSFIALWLRRENLEKLCEINYSDRRYLDGFCKNDLNFLMMAQPRGIVCQWIAPNMPTLGFFSIVQAILSKNGSLVKMPEEYIPLIVAILRELETIAIDHDGMTYHGRTVLGSIAIVSFEGKNASDSEKFSLVSDCRVVYGGSDAIRAISRLPCKDHCETIIFGPKYSFAVFDREYIESAALDKALDLFAKDVCVFNQMACSSPHVLFLERSSISLDTFVDRLRRSFGNLTPALKNQTISNSMSSKIINIRALYRLSKGKNCTAPQDLGWTILTDQNISLEEPIQGKCIFIKEVNSVDQVIPLVNHKIQALSIGIPDPKKREKFAREATYRGVDRVVIPGAIHDFTLPWDGIMTLNRLVRWVILKNN